MTPTIRALVTTLLKTKKEKTRTKTIEILKELRKDIESPNVTPELIIVVSLLVEKR